MRLDEQIMILVGRIYTTKLSHKVFSLCSSNTCKITIVVIGKRRYISPSISKTIGGESFKVLFESTLFLNLDALWFNFTTNNWMHKVSGPNASNSNMMIDMFKGVKFEFWHQIVQKILYSVLISTYDKTSVWLRVGMVHTRRHISHDHLTYLHWCLNG